MSVCWHKNPLSGALSCPVWEKWSVALLFAGFLALNLLTATRYPFVWADEVFFTDPAVNLYLGYGFTSSEYIQHFGEFWAGNTPLHSALLFLWVKVFGFTILATRSINYVYMAIASLLTWRASARLNLVTTPKARLTLLALIVGGYSLIFAYRGGRYDCLAMLIVAGLFYAHTLEKRWQELCGFFALALMAPWAGLQLLPLFAVGGLLLLFFLGRKFLPQFLAAAIGTIGGIVSLGLFYKTHGVFHQFFFTPRTVVARGFFQGLARGHFQHSNSLPKDFSFWPIFGLAVLLALYLHRNGMFRWRSPLTFGLTYSVGLSVALVLAGHFPTEYGWMTYVPLCVCVCATLSQMSLPPALRLASVRLISAAIGLGLLLHGATAVYDWKDRDYTNVATLVGKAVTGTDWMYGDYSTYYAAKTLVKRVFFGPYYLSAFLDQEKRQLTVLIIAPEHLQTVTNMVGGRWVSTGERFVPQRRGFLGTKLNMGFLTLDNYELEVYRRAETNP
jgi:hypothetical protein